jgi:hypothetical protein
MKDHYLAPYLVIILAMTYITFKLTCNPIFFRQIEFFIPFTQYQLKLVGSALIYPGIYVLSDALLALSNRKTTILIIIIGILCDGLFSWTITHISQLDIPTVMSPNELTNTLAVNTIGSQMWTLYYHGVFAALAAAIAEILIFAALLKKWRNFFVSTTVSVVITLVAHNLINDYAMLKSEPDALQLIFHNLATNISIMIIYAAIVNLIMSVFFRNFVRENSKLKDIPSGLQI